MEKIKSEWRLDDLYRKYAPLVHRRCLQILCSEDEAWDATQEIFMKLMNSMDSIQKRESIYYWLNRTTTHHCISVLRKKRGIGFSEAEHGQSTTHTPEKEFILKEALQKLFGPWNKTTREIVIYTYIDGYTQKEISELMKMGESTIRKHLTKFRRKSQEWKKKQDQEEQTHASK